MKPTPTRYTRDQTQRMSKKKKYEDYPRLLMQLADAMNACEKAGLKIRLRHGAVMTKGGYVLPTEKEWVARSSVYMGFDPPDDDDDMDL